MSIWLQSSCGDYDLCMYAERRGFESSLNTLRLIISVINNKISNNRSIIIIVIINNLF